MDGEEKIKDAVLPGVGDEADKKAKTKKTKDQKPKGNQLKLLLESMNPREKMILKTTGIIVGLLILDLVIIHPVSRYIDKLDEEIQVQESIVPKRLLILKHKEAILRDYKAGEPLMADPKLSQEEEIAKLLGEIERVSKEVGLFIFNINPVKVNKKSDSIYELTVDIEGKGGINQIRRFMKTIESANPPIRISGFNLRPQSRESEDLKCMISIAKIGVKRNPYAYSSSSDEKDKNA